MKVCLVNAMFPPDAHGGAENYVLRTAKALERRGHDAAVLTTKPYDGRASLSPTKTTYEGVEVWRYYPLNVSHRSDGTGGNPVTKAVWHQLDTRNPHSRRAAGQVFDRLDPDVVHTNNLVGISPGIGRVLAERDVRHVHTLHDYSLICPKSNLLRDLTAPDGERTVCEDPPVPCRLHAGQKRRLIGDPDVVTGPSQHVIDVHRRHGFFTEARCERIQLGVESVADEPPPIPDDTRLLYVGQQQESKGLATLLDAADRLDAVQFDICGTGPYAEETQRRAETMPNVTYHGFVSEEELGRLRRRATAGVVPSIWMENSPLTIYESFAVGLPIIGSDIGGIPELVADGEHGFTFEPKSVRQLAETIEKIAEHDRSLRETVLEWASKHTFDAHVDELERVYAV